MMTGWAIIDPYGDNKKGYEIFVNPYGVQGDLIWTKQGENSSYDMIFQRGNDT
jgi:hypothetical protein